MVRVKQPPKVRRSSAPPPASPSPARSHAAAVAEPLRGLCPGCTELHQIDEMRMPPALAEFCRLVIERDPPPNRRIRFLSGPQRIEWVDARGETRSLPVWLFEDGAAVPMRPGRLPPAPRLPRDMGPVIFGSEYPDDG